MLFSRLGDFAPCGSGSAGLNWRPEEPFHPLKVVLHFGLCPQMCFFVNKGYYYYFLFKKFIVSCFAE
jgi:hypothetical protein